MFETLTQRRNIQMDINGYLNIVDCSYSSIVESSVMRKSEMIQQCGVAVLPKWYFFDIKNQKLVNP